MKNDETTRYYESPFAAHMADFIRYKRAHGLKYDAVPRSLRSFSRFLSAKGADDASIGKELIEEWCSFRPNENRLTQRRRIVETTQFLKYLSERGVDVHLPRPTRKSRARGAFVPHIFSHEELRRFFEECDRISARAPSMMPVMLPLLFRLLLGCGLRISEALGLRLGDTDLDNGILVIRKSKFNKDRLIPLSDSLLAVLRRYRGTYHKIPKDDKEPFFAHRDGRIVSQNNIYTWFRKVVWAAGISHGGRGGTPSLITYYAYDPLGNLLRANQYGGTGDTHRGTRSFSYDALSRLIQGFNPESGWTCYGTTGGSAPNGFNCTSGISGYDGNGNLLKKVDARGTTINYTYDSLNRLLGKTYSDSTPAVAYNYDQPAVSWVTFSGLGNPIGRLTSATVGGTNIYSQYAYSYDPNGRLLYKLFSLPNSTGTGVQSSVGSSGSYYDLAGNVYFTDLGTGVQLSQIRDSAGQTTKAYSNKHTTSLLGTTSSYTLFDHATYTAAGALCTRELGDGLTEIRTYDNRNRLTSGSQSQIASPATYSCGSQSQTGSPAAYSFNVTPSPNGNVSSSVDSVNQNWNYNYDHLNRLTSATSSLGLSLAWSYDSFGNRMTQTATGTGSAMQPTFPFTGNTNRIDPSSGIVYDATGNVTNDGVGDLYTYDAEGRISSAMGGSVIYKYDAEGQLVYESGPQGVEVFSRNAQGQPTVISNPTAGGPPYNMIGAYIDGEQIGSWQTDRFSWVGKDWLGTKRFESAGVGDIASTASPTFPRTYTSLPFGDGLSSVGTDPTHFTGKERDAETGLDYMDARYYGSTMGRFMSPDPLGGHLENPQSLNKYAYALNNPLTNTDPTGLDSYLQCTSTKDNASTCQSQRVGGTDKNPQMAAVQGVTKDGKFTATQIGNDANGNLVDKTTGTGSYTASVNGSGVQFSNNGGQTSSTGVFVNGTPQTTFQDAGFANGGALSGFNFTLTNSKMEANQAEAGFFRFNGTPEQAGGALERAGFQYMHGIGANGDMNEYRSFGTGIFGANAGHFNVQRWCWRCCGWRRRAMAGRGSRTTGMRWTGCTPRSTSAIRGARRSRW